MMQNAEDLATEDALDQLKAIYHDIIEQYYKYKTIRYVRHGEPKRGTGKGSNLYNTFDVQAERSLKDFDLFLRLQGDNISGYRQVAKDHRAMDPDPVVDRIISGNRPMIPWVSHGDLPFIANISSPIGQFTGTPIGILNGNDLWDSLDAYRQERFDYYASRFIDMYIK